MRKASEERLLTLARKQFKRCEVFEDAFRQSFVDDVKFSMGDPDNGWQWPNQLFVGRRASQKPTLTVNQIRHFNNLIINDIKKAPPGIIVRPESDGSTVASAQLYSNWIRNICRKSRSGDIFGRAARFQVDGGVGYWRVITEYENDMSMKQTARLKSVRDMMSVYLDPDAKEPDKSDAKFGFVFEDVLKDDVHRDHPELARMNGVRSTSYLREMMGWVTENHYRVAEWFNLVETKDEIVHMIDEDTGDKITEWLSKIPEALRDEILANPLTQRRKGTRKQMKWYKIIGDKIVAERDWPGKYVPIIQVVGDEVIIEGKLDRKGNTRLLKDAQRMDNYWMSAATEHVALQTKTPWLTDLKAIEGYETYWANANVTNAAYLPYRSADAQGKPIQKPERAAAPEFSAAYVTGMQIAATKLALISGQRTGAEGQVMDPAQSDTQSGRAILAKKAQGETSTFNYRDNLSIGVAYTGKILLDLLPRITDTERMIKTVAQDGEEQDVNINPALKSPMEEKDKEDEENAKDIFFNPAFGTYDIDADAGPDFTTQRQYAVEAMGTIVARNNELWNVIGDLLVKNMDFPGAEEMAERIRRTIPQQILGEGPTKDMQVLMAQNQHLTELLENFAGLLAGKNLELKNKDDELAVKAYDSETKRLKEMGNAEENFRALGLEEPLKKLVMETLQQAFTTMLPDSVKKTDDQMLTKSDAADEMQAELPLPAPRHPNGRVSPHDGQEYVEHQPGQFARVEPEGTVQ